MNQTKTLCASAGIAFLFLSTVLAQSPKPKPAFPGQTEAPPPAKPSPAFTIETVAGRLNNPWSFAFLPDGNFLVTENSGTMRIARPDGVVSAPIAGVPGVKVVAAQGLHDRNGSIPKDNPWLSRATVSPETFAHGLRDPEGAAINPATGELWVTDHGPQGGEEINIIRAGRDYGWPDISYGRQYDVRRTDGR